MRLEDEIHQKFFKTSQQKLAVNLIYTTNWVHNHYLVHFKNTELTMQQYNVMRILRGQHPTPCSLKVIKERMLDRMSDASRIVDKLVAKNFVIRNQCPNDRRSVNLLISEKGLAVLKEIDVIDDATVEMFKNLNPEETNQLNDLLDKLRG
ncbi:MAG: MarR family transcriptional regulator [Bacteroidia bacterium]|nr:MarR family transcriptional regulator [Bacteroidia bacterium]